MRGTGTFMAPASGTGSSYAHGTGVSVPTDDEDEDPVLTAARLRNPDAYDEDGNLNLLVNADGTLDEDQRSWR